MEIKLINEINYDIPPSHQVLINRGIPQEKINEFLNTTDEVVSDYKNLDNIEEAVQCLLNHIELKHNILIQVDSDVDGYTSAAVLYNYLKSNFLGINLDYQVHNEKIHGLEITEDILNKKYELVIIPDAGSNQYDEHQTLYNIGIDIIVLDHHECEKESPYAIIVNNQLSLNYKNKALSGVGIVYQFCRAIDKINKYVQQTFADDYLDLVALGLVADMMDLRELETKRLVEKGIERIKNKEKNNNSFLKGMIEKQQYSIDRKGGISPITIAFYIAPYINSVVRVGTMNEKILTFEAMLEENNNKILPSTKRGCKGQEENLIDQAVRTLTNVKNRQKKSRDESFEFLDNSITEEYLNKNSIIFIDTKGTLDKNLNGLVANQIMSKYQRPTLILDSNEDYYYGSARNFESNVLLDFRGFIEQSNFAEYAQGHASAFGVKFKKTELERFLEYANKVLDFSNLHNQYQVDFIFDASEIREDIILDIASLTPYWGQGIKEAYIAIKNARINYDQKVLMSKDKNPTLKLIVNNIECLKFGSNETEFLTFAPNEYTSTLIDLVGKCDKNEYYGNIKGQIMIEEYEIKDNLIVF